MDPLAELPPSVSTARRARSYALVALLGLIALIPLWIPTFPAMCDAPQHASQTALFSALADPASPYALQFQRHSLIPNLLGYALLLLLSPFIGALAATKLIASAALLAILLASARLLEEFHSDPRLALLVIPAFYGYPFQWGFLGFLAAAPLGILFFLFVAVPTLRRPTASRVLLLVLAFLVLFFCHALIAAFTVALAFAYHLALRPSRRDLRLWMPLVFAILVAGIWWIASVASNPHTLAHAPLDWDLELDRLPNLFQDITGLPGALSASFAVLALLVPVSLLLGVRRQRRYYVLVGLCFALAMLAPRGILGVQELYQRFAIFFLPCFALILVPPAQARGRRGPLALAFLVLFSLAWTAGYAWRMQVFERESRGFATVLAHMEPNQRALSLNYETRSPVFEARVFLHFPAWYAALRGGVVDPSFACGNVDLVLYRPQALPRVRVSSFEYHPEQFQWQLHDGWRYRYFVVHSPTATTLFDSHPEVQLRAHDGHWWLYERTSPPSMPTGSELASSQP